MTMNLIDETVSSEYLFQVYRLYPQLYVVRVRIKRDFYQDQSYAVAEVLSRNSMTWTNVLTEPAVNWHHDHKSEEQLRKLAAWLTKRTENVLAAE